MNERAKITYDLLLANSEKGLITTKKEIVDNYPYDPNTRKDGYVWNDNPKSHDNCSTVWEDINEINHTKGTMIVIPYKGNYWIGTKEEAKAYVKDYFSKQCSPSLKRYWNLMRKINKDGDVDIFTEEIYKAFFEDTNGQ